MLKFFGFVLKATFFTFAVLVLGQLVHVGGRSVSDQFKGVITRFERGEGIANLRRSAEELVKSANLSPAGKEAAGITTGAPSDGSRAPARAGGTEVAGTETGRQKDMAGRVREIREQERAALDSVIEQHH